MERNLDRLIAEAARMLKQLGAREVYVFGSAARGDVDDSSDVDLAVSGLPAKEYLNGLASAMQIVRRDVDLIDLDEKSNVVSVLREKGGLRRVV